VRVFIVSDMEGVAGIVRWDQVSYGKEAYQEGRRLYTAEINAAVRGARSGGATEIVVMDCHGAGGDGSFNSLIPEELDPGCEYVVQKHWTEYTAFLEFGCDAALFVAMHARAGTLDGVMSHTVSGSQWHNLWFNGRLVGETGINAALCGNWGVPVLLVTGDSQSCAEATDLLGASLTTVAVKTGIGRYSARQHTPARAREMIEAGARQALSDLKAVAPYDPGRPCEIKVEFAHADGTEIYRYRLTQGVEIVDSRTIVSRAIDWWTAWRHFYF
jgi:D-amino peptidase